MEVAVAIQVFKPHEAWVGNRHSKQDDQVLRFPGYDLLLEPPEDFLIGLTGKYKIPLYM